MSGDEPKQELPKSPKKRQSKISDKLAMFEQQSKPKVESPKKPNANSNTSSSSSSSSSLSSNTSKAKSLASAFETKIDINKTNNDDNKNNNNDKIIVPKQISGGIAARLAAINQSMDKANSPSPGPKNDITTTTNNNKEEKKDNKDSNTNRNTNTNTNTLNNNDSMKQKIGGVAAAIGGKLGAGLNIPMGGLKVVGLPPSLLKKRQEQQQQSAQSGQNAELQLSKFDRPLIKAKRRAKTHINIKNEPQSSLEMEEELRKYLKGHFEYDEGMIIAERYLLQHLQECTGIDLHKHLDIINSPHHSNYNDNIHEQIDENDSKMSENQIWDTNKLNDIIIDLFGDHVKHNWGYQIRVTN